MVLGRARLQPCRPEPIDTRALAPEGPCGLLLRFIMRRLVRRRNSVTRVLPGSKRGTGPLNAQLNCLRPCHTYDVRTQMSAYKGDWCMKSATTIRPFARLLFRSLAALVLLSALSAFLPLASAQTHTIHGNTPGFIQKAQDLGAVDPSSVISVTAWLKLHNEGKLDQLVESQKQKGSANYQKWITQAQFNASFSPTAQEVKAVENFLSAHGLATLTVAENNFYVKVQGTVGAIEKTFNVQIDSYSLKGATYRSNKADPKVNGTAGGLIAAVTGLDDYGFQPMVVRPSGPDGKPVASIPLNA